MSTFNLKCAHNTNTVQLSVCALYGLNTNGFIKFCKILASRGGRGVKNKRRKKQTGADSRAIHTIHTITASVLVLWWNMLKKTLYNVAPVIKCYNCITNESLCLLDHHIHNSDEHKVRTKTKTTYWHNISTFHFDTWAKLSKARQLVPLKGGHSHKENESPNRYAK